jgi:hypothetical protein
VISIDSQADPPTAGTGIGSSGPSQLATPLPSPNDVSRISTEIDILPSVHHSVYTQGTNDRADRDDKEHRDEKEIYAPALNRNHSESQQVRGFWRRIIPSTWVCRLLISVVIIESLFDLAILVSFALGVLGGELMG